MISCLPSWYTLGSEPSTPALIWPNAVAACSVVSNSRTTTEREPKLGGVATGEAGVAASNGYSPSSMNVPAGA